MIIMKYWKFKVFIKERGTDVIRKWLKDLPKGAQVEIKTRFEYLTTLRTWGWPHSAKRKKSNYIHEIRIKWQRNQYRPLGFFGPNQGEFTLLIGAIEQNWKLKPRDAQKSAEQRRKLILKGGKNIDDYFKES